MPFMYKKSLLTREYQETRATVFYSKAYHFRTASLPGHKQDQSRVEFAAETLHKMLQHVTLCGQ